MTDTRVLASLFCFVLLAMTMGFTAFARGVWWLPVAILHRIGHEQGWAVNESHKRMRRELLRRRDWILTGYVAQVGLDIAAVEALWAGRPANVLYAFTLGMVAGLGFVCGLLSRSLVVMSRCPRTPRREGSRGRLRTILLGKATPPAVGHGGA